MLAQQKKAVFFFLHLEGKSSSTSSLAVSVGVQTAMPGLVGMMWELDC